MSKRKRTRKRKNSRKIAVAIGIAICIAVALVTYRQLNTRNRITFKTRGLRFKPIRFDRANVPKTIRVLRTKMMYTQQLCQGSYQGRCIQQLSFENYVRGVVTAEEGVFRSTAKRFGAAGKRRVAEAWKLQAIAARTYALYVVLSDKHRVTQTGFQISDTPRDQAYTDRYDRAIDLAVRTTRGRVLTTRTGRLIYAEYSASCHSKGTRSVIDRRQIRCHKNCKKHGFARSSHFRGMCQWGSFLYAMDGRRLSWLLKNYYPAARVVRSGPRRMRKISRR